MRRASTHQARFHPYPSGQHQKRKKAKSALGTHGGKVSEQKRLKAKFGLKVSGDSHQSEHAIGYAVAADGAPRGENGALERAMPAYQEQYGFHRAHVGTGSGADADEYRDHQRALLESGAPGVAVQLNQLHYAFQEGFQDDRGVEGQQADDSYNVMVQAMRSVPYFANGQTQSADVSAKERAEMRLTRSAATTGKFPTIAEENEARRLENLPELDENVQKD